MAEKKIDKLTPEQTAKLPVYVDKWLEIGLNTDPCNFEASIAAAQEAYRAAELEPPKWYVLADSPMHAAKFAVLLKRLWFGHGNTSADETFGGRDSEQLQQYLEDELAKQSVVDSISDKEINEAISQQIYGAHEAGWLSFYDFMGIELEIEECSKLNGLIELAKNCGWWSPYSHVAIFQHRHTEVNLIGDETKVLHKDGGPAVLYRDGFSVWALNGVRVPQWLAEEHPGQIDVSKLHEIDNAQVRAEFIRKVGVERIHAKLGGNVIDKDSFTNEHGTYEYELVDLETRRGEDPWRYLLMHNPSVPELSHLEGVQNNCRTVKEALNFRNGLTEDQIDDVNGADWYQQGDVLMRPKGATKFKRFPKVLT